MSRENVKPLKFILLVCFAAAIIIPANIMLYYRINNIPIRMGSIMYGVIFSFSITASISVANYYTIHCIDKWFPWTRNKAKRFISEILITNFNASFIMAIVVIVLQFFWYRMVMNGATLLGTIYNNVIIAVIVNTIVVAIYEGQSLIRSWLHSLIEIEQLRREKAESKYSVLKNQVNPHFLFNSLNSLSSLIRLSPEKAIEFVDKFARIYRYVLDVSEKPVVEVREELDFLQSYYFLQKIRFGDHLNISVNVDANRMNEFLLPLSIQTLLENAIKHNEVSSDKPLHISISVEDDFLVVSNNLQIKHVFSDSTGIGLANLRERYAHFTEILPIFYATAQQYIAKLPLLKEND